MRIEWALGLGLTGRGSKDGNYGVERFERGDRTDVKNWTLGTRRSLGWDIRLSFCLICYAKFDRSAVTFPMEFSLKCLLTLNTLSQT